MSHTSPILFNVAGFKAAHTRLLNSRSAYNTEGTRQSAYAYLCAHAQFFTQCAHAGLFLTAAGYANNADVKAHANFSELLYTLGFGIPEKDTGLAHAMLYAVRVAVSNEERHTFASAHALLHTLHTV